MPLSVIASAQASLGNKTHISLMDTKDLKMHTCTRNLTDFLKKIYLG